MNKIEFGDCRETMRRWASQGIKAQTCVTSPPYYGLRDYGHDGQIGLEETPEEYIKAMVEVFRCVWDVLEDSGTLWLNIGDSYCNSNSFAIASPEYQREGRNNMPADDRKLDKLHATGLKAKDLIGIPWMLAFALRSDGWYLRQDIIWHKPNPMPESVQDRCTKAHEYIFMLTKNKTYYYDNESIKIDAINGDPSSPRGSKGVIGQQNAGNRKQDNTGNRTYSGFNDRYEPLEKANKRSVWSVTTKPYSGAHFAVFPSDLIEPCIMAGSRVGDIVLDPFMGSGTTAQVAQHLGRKYLGCELNPEYEALQNRRLSQLSLEL